MGGDDHERSVLLIDDDHDFAESLSSMLGRSGYHICCADSAERALAMLRAGRGEAAQAPVALIDVRLGGDCRGIDLIPHLRTTQPGLICVLMTRAVDSHAAIAALHRGANDYLDKSWDPDAVSAVLDRCFEGIA